MPEYFK